MSKNPSSSLFLFLIGIFATAALAQPSAPFKDPRDGKTYRTVKIGEQVWMAENLQFAAEGSVCYENKAENCKKYGRLYIWAVAMEVCPKGWHLPKNEEWDVLYKFADSGYVVENQDSKVAGKYLKAKKGWNEGGNGEDKCGFAALPSGYGHSDGGFNYVGLNGYWWSASEHAAGYAYFRSIRYYSGYAIWYNDNKANLQSVRCVRD